MAEAAIVEDRPQPQQRFYCHLCSVEIQLITPDFTCPLCSGGFIEELPAPTETPSEDVEMTEANGIDELEMIRDELATLLMSRGARPPESLIEDSQQGGGTGGGGGGGGGVGGVGVGVGVAGVGGANRGSRRGRRRLRMQTFDRFDNILVDILQSLSAGNDGNTSMFFMGNPGDYAWGHGGFDTIVTQLLNQMDTTGPPPLPREKIDEIPNVEITQDQVDIKLQCSVCWEDFKLLEIVRKLPCSHVYHENCIVPWLELHGTCPICRKSLSPETGGSLQNMISSMSHDSLNEPSHRHRSNSTGINTYSPTSSSSQPDTQLSGPGTVFATPFQLSRIFTQPGTSQIHHQQQQQQQQQHHHHQHQQPHQSSSVSNSTISSSRNRSGDMLNSDDISDSNNERNETRTSNQNDIFKYDDGNVDYEFD